MKNNETILQQGSFGSLLLKLSVPSVVVILVMLIYNMADTFFIGQTGDPNKIAAISLVLPLFTVFSGISTLFGNGGCASISIALGEGNTSKIKNVTAFCAFGCFLIGLLGFLFLFFGAGPVVDFLGAEGETRDAAISYLKVVAFAVPLVLYSSAYGMIIRFDGDAGAAMIANLAGTGSNIILDALFILVFKWDVFGAAFATVLGNLISFSLIILILVKKKQILLPHLKHLTFDPQIVIPVLTLGLPMAISTLISSVTNTISNRMMIAHGPIYLAAQSVAGKIGMLIVMLVMGICVGMQPAISYNYGRKDYTRMNKIVKDMLLFTIAVGIFLTIVVYLSKDALITAFIDNEEVILHGRLFVLASVVVGPLVGICQTYQTFLQATGKASYAIFISTLDKGIIYIPVLYIMNYFFQAYGIAFSHAVTMVFTFAVTVILTLRWKRQIISAGDGSHL